MMLRSDVHEDRDTCSEAEAEHSDRNAFSISHTNTGWLRLPLPQGSLQRAHFVVASQVVSLRTSAVASPSRVTYSPPSIA
ncbi:hypothetical protein VNO78_11146 [Psophocarpus tetragonolobus]|uniref:Uncharacterized protein n=1 Tax=Psophocarpus tetragonolobus TaxID=3891 RepID=A0AAN9ST31_PSOTE